MFEINDSYQLIYKYNETDHIVVDNTLIVKKMNEKLSELPKGSSILTTKLYYSIIMFSDKKELIVFINPVHCKFIDLKDTIPIYSFEQLKLILQKKINQNVYSFPYYYSTKKRKEFFIVINEIENIPIYHETYIEIKNKEEKKDLTKIKSIFNELKELYKNENFTDGYTFKFVSPNFASYFPLFKCNLNDEFHFIYDSKRMEIIAPIDDFLRS